MSWKTTKIATLVTIAFTALIILVALALGQKMDFIAAVPLAALTCIATYGLSAWLIERQLRNITPGEKPSVAPILLLSSTKIIIIASLFLVFITLLKIDIIGLIFGVSAFYLALTLTSLFNAKNADGITAAENRIG